MPGSPGSRLEFLVSKILANRNRLMEFLQLHAQNRNRPDGLRDSFLEQGQAFHTVLLRLISEGQATGEVAQGDPEQLAVAITACLDGLSKYAFRNPEKFTALFPDAGIVLRMIKP